MSARIYLDHAATSPPRPEVRLAVAAALESGWGNPSSAHAAGREARDVVERARAEVAALIGATPEEVVFTSGGTEGNHLAIRGLARAARARGGRAHVVSSAIEHPSVQGALDAIEGDGFTVTRMAVGARGELDAAAVLAALRADTALVTLGFANHELGNLYAIDTFAAAARDVGALFHTDAVQAGRVPCDLRAAGVDAATLSAHKLGGPKGVGALFLRRGVAFEPLVAGGHQERERRAGTENVPGIAGFGAACRLARGELESAAARIGRLRDRLQRELLAIPDARLHGDPDRRAPSLLNVGFEGADGQLVMIGLDLEGVCMSTGAACSSGTLAPSPVLLALGLAPARAREAVRFSLGPETTEADVDGAAALTRAVVERVRSAT